MSKKRTNIVNPSDERLPKLLGLLLLLVSVYLFVAFTSYLFTWREDQDRVLRFSWRLLTEPDLRAENWLGRLGAIVSNLFIYWWFGIPSYIIIYLTSLGGQTLLSKQPLSSIKGTARNAILLMAFLSLVLAFIFQKSDFPWGGNFGAGVGEWLSGLLGTLGLALFLLFLTVITIVWFTNPDFQGKDGGWVAKIKAIFENLFKEDEVPATITHKENKQKEEEDFNWEETIPISKSTTTTATTQSETKPKSGSLALDLLGEQKSKTVESEQRILTPTVTAQKQQEPDSELEIIAPPPQPDYIDSDEEPLPPTDHQYRPLQSPVTEEEDDIPSELINSQGLYDPTLELSSYEPPILPLLNDYSDQKVEIDRSELESNKDLIISTLLNYKIEIVKIRATVGPTVTLYEIIPAPGIRISKIKSLEDDIALNLAALGIRIIAPIPGRGTIGIEVPNKNKQMVSLKEVLLSDKFKKSGMELPIALGKTISNEVFVADLTKMPHLLIAGATGQGKSVGINTVLMSLLYKLHPAYCKFVLIDPKKVELFPYSGLANHFLAFLPDQKEPIITDTAKVINTLQSLCIEMDNRYNLLKKASVRNIKEYNEKFTQRQLNPRNGHQFLPFIVLIIDEFADLIMTAGKEIELPIGRLAQLSRAVGIHLIIATQRPSVNIITGVIKANFPARLAFKVSSKVDSRTILDTGGADQLIGRGDMLLSLGGDMVRLQCAFVDTPEVERVLDFISNQKGYSSPYYLPEYVGADGGGADKEDISAADLDDFFDDAARLVVQIQSGSTSMIQRRLKLGYNRAGRIMDQLEAMGIVGPSEGSKPREVLYYDEAELERYLSDLRVKKGAV